jgi:DNA-binding transcriptional ArsR family regulator
MALNKSFRALNRYTCRKTLDCLRAGPQPVAEIAARLKLGTRANISQALALLLEAGLVVRRRQGRQHFYEIKPAAFEELTDYLRGFLPPHSPLKRTKR